MNDKNNQKMISAYFKESPIPRHFSGAFNARPENFYNAKEVTIDVEREDEDIAVVVNDIKAGTRFTTTDEFVNKKFTPPVIGEGWVITSFDLMDRVAGEHNFQDPVYQRNATVTATKNNKRVEKMIRRTIELQAAQIFQTAKVDLYDESGAIAYTLDYKGKIEHFPSVTTSWGAMGSTKIADLEGLAEEIRNNGLAEPDILEFGDQAWNDFISDDEIQKLLDNRRINIGELLGATKGSGGGATFRGMISIGSYQFECWTYNGRYKHPVTGVKTKYLATDKVVMRTSDARMDATFGGIPLLVQPEQRLMQFIPPRLSQTGENGIDLFPNAWATDNGETVKGTLKSRPLLIPTDIDSFGCLTTTAP